MAVFIPYLVKHALLRIVVPRAFLFIIERIKILFLQYSILYSTCDSVWFSKGLTMSGKRCDSYPRVGNYPGIGPIPQSGGYLSSLFNSSELYIINESPAFLMKHLQRTYGQ